MRLTKQLDAAIAAIWANATWLRLMQALETKKQHEHGAGEDPGKTLHLSA